MLKRETLEKYQVLLYLLAISSGLGVGLRFPNQVYLFTLVVWPLLALLLYTTFTQVPLARIQAAFKDRRFMVAAITGNFLILPVIVWGLMLLGPDEPAVKLGILLVLLVPCTDWFITFTHLGGGETKHAIAFSPFSLLLQLVLLPVYVWLFLGAEVTASLIHRELLLAFFGLILLPLIAAFATEKWAERRKHNDVIDCLAWFPVPLLAVVVFCIAATQVNIVLNSTDLLMHLLVIFVAFLIIAGLLAKWLANYFQLPVKQGRVLAFSLGSRNSFVMLPLALALPYGFELAVVVIVFQSLVELFGMAIYLWWVPEKLFIETG